MVGGLGKCCGRWIGLASAVAWMGLASAVTGEGLASAVAGEGLASAVAGEGLANAMTVRELSKCRPVYMYSLGIFCMPKSSAHENTKINTVINISSIVVHLFSSAEYAEFWSFSACV